MRIAILLSIVALASGCAASTADSTEGSSAAETANTADAGASTLVADLKAAYEASGGTSQNNQTILEGTKDIAWSTITGPAREAYNEYAQSADWGLMAYVGSPIAQSGTFEGQTVLYVAGDLSDTGSEFGFYDEAGNALAVAYAGQGEHPGPGGVDWGN